MAVEIAQIFASARGCARSLTNGDPQMDASLTPLPRESAVNSTVSVPQWLQLARNGSHSALGQALQGSRDVLLRVAQRALDDKLRSKLGASDLVQDTFADAHKGFGQFRGNTPEEFQAWLLSILSHRLANHVRHYRMTQRRDVRREVAVERGDEALASVRDVSATPATAALAEEDQRLVHTVLEKLPESARAIIIERTWQGASFAEIGARRGISSEAARKAWARAVRKMQGFLQDLR